MPGPDADHLTDRPTDHLADDAALATTAASAEPDAPAASDREATSADVRIEVDVDVDRLAPAADPADADGRATPAEEPCEADVDVEAAASADARTDVDDEADEDGVPSLEDEACPNQALAARVEALLFASDRPLTERRLAQLCGLPAAGAVGRVREALAELDGLLRATGRSFRPRKVAGGWQLVTLPAFGPLMARLHRDRQETRLTPAAMETLSIIAYRQPVLRAELEAIRGVACGEVLRTLMERRMVSIVGRSEELGRPMLYGTTRQFLEVFGLASLDDLPEVAGLERRPAPPKPRPQAETDQESADDVVVEPSADADADGAGATESAPMTPDPVEPTEPVAASVDPPAGDGA